MSKLEEFINENRSAFDDHNPSEALWKRLEKKLDGPTTQKPVRFISRTWVRWAAAAAIIIIAGAGAISYFTRDITTHQGIAKYNAPDSNSLIAKNDKLADSETNETVATDSKPAPGVSSTYRNLKNDKEVLQAAETNDVKEELFHYARLIEIKQKQIETLQTASPALFSQFSNDLEKLERSYTGLKTRLETGLNSEQVLEAMIQNLKMQATLLNKQLEISKKLNNNHKEDEKKSINNM